MLIIHSISTPEDRAELLCEFDAREQTWLVSDLATKFDLSRRFLGEADFLSGEAILRASELWRVLIIRARPDLQVVSRKFAVTLISEMLAEPGRPDWARSPGAPTAAFEYLTQLMPLLAHENGRELADAWLKKHDEAVKRWGRWHDLSHDLWARFAAESFVAREWLAGILVNEQNLWKRWKRPLYFDLGAEMTQVEADLAVTLSAERDVHILKSDPAWILEAGKALQPYEIFEKRLGAERRPSRFASQAGRPLDKPKNRPIFKKTTTAIAEAKEAVAQARQWLDAGAALSDIAIVAPDIEIYWLPLAACLEVEGIPTQKSKVARLHSFPDVAAWLARLRLRSGACSEADLELCLFDGENGGKAIDFSRFSVLFASIYGREDMARSADVASLFAIELDENSVASREEFMAWALKQAPADASPERFEKIFGELCAEAPESTRIAVKRWVAYVSQIAASIEATISEGVPSGVAILNLVSAKSSPCRRMSVLGLTESALRSGSDTNVLFSDVLSLSGEFGFYLPHADRAKLEFEARLLIEDDSRELLLICAETDFSGSVQAPAWIWVKGAIEAEGGMPPRACAPRPIRWDELQKAPAKTIAAFRGWPSARAELIQNSIQEDLALKPLSNYAGDLPIALSPSGLEDYLACPFIYAAKRIFRLSDQASLDLDVDASTRGKLMHAVFERLAREPFQSERSAQEIGEIVDEARVSAAIELADERLWLSLRAKHIDLGLRFVAAEKEWRRRFPQTKTVGSETLVRGFVDPSTGRLTREASVETAVPFRGFIDRVDFDAQGFAAIVDYKSSGGQLSSFASWIANDKLQLLLYAQAFENGLTELEPRPVANAAYLVAKSLDRDKGFKLKDVEQGLYDLIDRKQNKATSSQKQEMFAAAAEKMRGALEKMRAGAFAPAPRDVASCVECKWNQTCRLPSLNS